MILGGSSMSPSNAGCLRRLLLGCCLLAAAGCQFHRTGQGFIVQGQPWSLTFDRGCADSASCGCCAEKPVATSAHQAAAKAELLPWRSRLKGYRLAGRLFHRGEPEEAKSAGSVGEIRAPNQDLFAPRRGGQTWCWSNQAPVS